MDEDDVFAVLAVAEREGCGLDDALEYVGFGIDDWNDALPDISDELLEQIVEFTYD